MKEVSSLGSVHYLHDSGKNEGGLVTFLLLGRGLSGSETHKEGGT